MKKNRDLFIIAFIYIAIALIHLMANVPLLIGILIISLGMFHSLTYIGGTFRAKREQEREKTELLKSLNRSEERTMRTQTQFYSLIEELGSGVLFIDAWNTIQLANKEFLDMFDYEDILKTPMTFLSHHKKLYKVVKKGVSTKYRIRSQIMVNDTTIMDVIVTPVFDEGVYYGSLILVHDITALKTAEQFQKQFTADVSHELKTPLSAIKGLSEILTREEKVEPAKQKEFLGIIKNEASRLEIILNDLLTISKMDCLDYKLKIEEAQIDALINETFEIMKPLAVEKKLSLTKDIEPCTFPFDSTKLRQVIINLIKNAINYTDVGYVKITGHRIDTHYIINVIDSGIGIEKSKQSTIFKRFYRVDVTRSRDTGGSGLGLSIIKNVVLKHGGTINLESALNKGSRFTVALPLNQKGNTHEKQS
jgi:two-component system phosphate regulon sensor histidine kinase PhoR